MNALEPDVRSARFVVDERPHDPYARCTLACLLAATGAHHEAMTQLAIAMGLASSPIAAGCVSSAIREVADTYAGPWQLPTTQRSSRLVRA